MGVEVTWPAVSLSFHCSHERGRCGPDRALDMQRRPGPSAPGLGRWIVGSQDSEILSASQVAISGGEGWDT